MATLPSCTPAWMHGVLPSQHLFLMVPLAFQTLDLSFLIPCLLTYKEALVRWLSFQVTQCLTQQRAMHVSEGHFGSVVGLVALSLPLISHSGLLSWCLGTPRHKLCSHMAHCPGHASPKEIAGLMENIFFPSFSMPTVSLQVLFVFLCPPCAPARTALAAVYGLPPWTDSPCVTSSVPFSLISSEAECPLFIVSL